jgi:TolB-like protein
MTRVLAEYLAQNNNEIIGPDTVIAFMANNRIRNVGYLESFDVFRVRDELRAGFVLLGTIMQQKERPEPTMALALYLVRTSDARTVWSYNGSVTTSEER